MGCQDLAEQDLFEQNYDYNESQDDQIMQQQPASTQSSNVFSTEQLAQIAQLIKN